MVKSILFKVVIEGSGIVNFDSNNQKYLWNCQENVERCYYNNVSFGKARYYKSNQKTDNGNDIFERVPVISADCIRHNLYEFEMSTHLPNIMHDDNLLLNFVATPTAIERGYLFALRGSCWKRKSPLHFGYAKAVNYSAPALETYSNSQQKTGKDKSEEAAETSFFKREVRGDTKYELVGGITTEELAFISMSEIHDRMAFPIDYKDIFREKLSLNIGSEVSQAGYFKKNGDIYDIPEFGILLTQEQVRFLVIDILKRLARFNLSRTTTGTAETTRLEIKFVKDPLVDTPKNPDGWVEFYNNFQINENSINSIVFKEGYSAISNLDEKAQNEIDSYRKKYGYEEKKAQKKI